MYSSQSDSEASGTQRWARNSTNIWAILFSTTPQCLKSFKGSGSWIPNHHMYMHPKSKSFLLPILLLLFIRHRAEMCMHVHVCGERECVYFSLFLLKKQIPVILSSSPSQLPFPMVIPQALAFKCFSLWPGIKYLHPSPVHKYTVNTPSFNGNKVFKKCNPLWSQRKPKLGQLVLNIVPILESSEPSSWGRAASTGKKATPPHTPHTLLSFLSQRGSFAHWEQCS